MAKKDTGVAGELVLNVSESTLDSANNRSKVAWSFYLNENGPYYSSSYSGGVTGNSVTVPGGTNWSGTFAFSWSASGYQSTLIASGSSWITHELDGSKSLTVSATMGDTKTSGAGGPTSLSQSITLTKFDRGGLEYWDGSSWNSQFVEYWNGSSWNSQFVEYWNGSSWVKQK